MKTKIKFKFLKCDHKNKIIYVLRQLNPPTFNARFADRLRETYPDYQIVKEYEN